MFKICLIFLESLYLTCYIQAFEFCKFYFQKNMTKVSTGFQQLSTGCENKLVSLVPLKYIVL